MITPSQLGAIHGEKNRFWTRSRFWLGIVSSLAFLWLVIRQVSWPQVLATLQTTDWKLVLLGLLLMTVTWAFFAVRWQVLLAPVVSIHWSDAFSYIMIGYLGNAVLPLRLGDVGRVMLLSRRYRINLGFASATVVMEKLLDVLTMVALMGFLMLGIPVPPLIQRGVQAATVAIVGAFVALTLLSHSQSALARLESFLSISLPQRVLATVLDLLYRFVQGLQVTKSLGQMLSVILLSLLSWGAAGLGIFCFVRAFKLGVPWAAAMLVLGTTNLGGAIPSSPGAIGVYEFLTMLALSVWTSERSVSAGFATVTHAATLALTIVLGLITGWREGIRWSTITTQSWVGAADEAEATRSTPTRMSRG
jgi:uncharacterized protein (TIRG00374 family)